MHHQKLGRIFSTFYRHGSIARDQLAREAEVSPAGISISTSNLLGSGVLRVSGERASRGGRRAEILELQATSRLLIGVDLHGQYLRMGLVDLAGAIHRSIPETIDNSRLTFRLFLNELRNFLDGISDEEAARLLAIGVATPELLAPDATRMVSSNRIQWLGLAAGEALARETGLPAFLTRSVDALILGEKWFGAARTASNSLLVALSTGIGCGLLVDGGLYTGSSLLAGEFGHTTVDPQGAACYCGKRGCLETIATGTRMVDAYREAAGGLLPAAFTLDDLCAGARAGDPAAMEPIRRASQYLGLGLSNLIQVLNPEQVIFGGALAKHADLFVPVLEAAITQFTMPMLAGSTHLVASTLGPEAGCKGAAACALHLLLETSEGVQQLLRPTGVR